MITETIVRKPALRLADKVWNVVFFVQLLLGLRVFFLLSGQPEVGFVSFIYTISNVFVAPFRLLVPSMHVPGAFYYDPASAVALVAWPLLTRVIFNFVDSVRAHIFETKRRMAAQ